MTGPAHAHLAPSRLSGELRPTQEFTPPPSGSQATVNFSSFRLFSYHVSTHIAAKIDCSKFSLCFFFSRPFGFLIFYIFCMYLPNTSYCPPPPLLPKVRFSFLPSFANTSNSDTLITIFLAFVSLICFLLSSL